MNAGLGEGVSYRARLLIAIRTEITDSVDLSPSAVELEPTFPITEVVSSYYFQSIVKSDQFSFNLINYLSKSLFKNYLFRLSQCKFVLKQTLISVI